MDDSRRAQWEAGCVRKLLLRLDTTQNLRPRCSQSQRTARPRLRLAGSVGRWAILLEPGLVQLAAHLAIWGLGALFAKVAVLEFGRVTKRRATG